MEKEVSINWEEELRKHKGSGLSMEEFVKDKPYSLYSLKYHKYNPPSKGNETKFIPISINKSRGISINGYQINIEGKNEEELLSMIMKAIK